MGAEKAAIRLHKDEATPNEDGHTILDESPKRETAKIVTVLDANNDLVPARAKSATAAKSILREVMGYGSPAVALEMWIFEDRETDDHHEGEVWVTHTPEQGGSKKKPKKKLKKKPRGKVKSTGKLKKKAAKRRRARTRSSPRRRSK